MPAVTLSVFSHSAQPVVLTVCVLGVGFMVWFLAGLLLDAGGGANATAVFLSSLPESSVEFDPVSGESIPIPLTVRFSSPQSTGDRRNRLPWIEVRYRD